MMWLGILVKMLQYGWPNFVFIIHYFSKSSPAFLYCNYCSNISTAKKTELLWQGTCNKHIQWQLRREQTLHMRQQAGGGQSLSRKKAAKARARRLSPGGRATWWGRERMMVSLRCTMARWHTGQNHGGNDRTKYHSTGRHNRVKLDFQNVFEGPRIHRRIFPDFVIFKMNVLCNLNRLVSLMLTAETWGLAQRSHRPPALGPSPCSEYLSFLHVAGRAVSPACLRPLSGRALPSSWPSPSSRTALNQRWLCRPGDIWQCMDTFAVVTMGGGDATVIWTIHNA